MERGKPLAHSSAMSAAGRPARCRAPHSLLSRKPQGSRTRLQPKCTSIANHSEFPINFHRHRIGPSLTLAATKLAPEPPVAGVPRVEHMSMRLASDRANGFIEGRRPRQFLFNAPDQVAFHFALRCAMYLRKKVIRRIAQKPRAAVNVGTIVIRQ